MSSWFRTRMTYLHFLGLGAALVAELHKGHHHGQTQTSDQDIKDSCYVTERESAGLLLAQHTQGRKEWGQSPSGQRHQ